MSEIIMPTTLNLPSNSNSSKVKEEQSKPKVTKVIEGKVVTKKRGLGRRLADIFFSEATGSVKDYIIQDVLIPTIKDTFADIVIGTTETMVYGKRRKGYRTTASSGAYVPYRAISANQTAPNRSSRPTSKYYVEDIILQTRPEAENVLSNMVDMIKDWGAVSVGELYEMVGIAGVHTDNSWGWTDLGNADVRRVSEGYMLMLPRIECIK